MRVFYALSVIPSDDIWLFVYTVQQLTAQCSTNTLPTPHFCSETQTRISVMIIWPNATRCGLTFLHCCKFYCNRTNISQQQVTSYISVCYHSTIYALIIRPIRAAFKAYVYAIRRSLVRCVLVCWISNITRCGCIQLWNWENEKKKSHFLSISPPTRRRALATAFLNLWKDESKHTNNKKNHRNQVAMAYNVLENGGLSRWIIFFLFERCILHIKQMRYVE